jgi:hypothetical protein
MSADLDNYVKLRRPCENFPFRKHDAIMVAPGRPRADRNASVATLPSASR